MIPSIKPDAIVSIGWADRSYQRLLLYGNIHKVPVVIVSDSIINTEKHKRRIFIKEFIKKIILKVIVQHLLQELKVKNI